jgi:hypothetical protein
MAMIGWHVLLVVLCLSLATTWTVFGQEVVPGQNGAPLESSKASNKKIGRDWNKIDMNAVDKAWENGDDASILENEIDVNRRVLARKQPRFNPDDGASIRNAYDSDPFLFSGGGGMMIFVDLKATQSNGKPWTGADIDLLCKTYSSLMRSGSVVTTVFNIGDNRLLINSDKTWQTRDILLFLARQKDVRQFTANSKDYNPRLYRRQFDPTYDEDEDDEDDEL